MNLAKVVSNEHIEYFKRISVILDETNLKIIDAVKRLGPRNMSKIARYIGEDPKKVSYRFNVIKAKTGLIIRALPSYSSMGLTNTMMFLPLDHKRVDPIKRILEAMRIPKKIYRVFGNMSGIIGQLIIPNEAMFFLEETMRKFLTKEEFETMRILYITDFIFTSPDLSKLSLTYRVWDYMPSELKRDFLEGKRIHINEDLKKSYLDKTDVYILSRLVEDATVPLMKIAEELGTNPVKIKYHFDNHLIKQGLIRDYSIYFPRYSPELSGWFFFEFTFDREDYMERFLYALSKSIYVHAFAKELGKLRVIALLEMFWGDLSDVLQVLSELCVSGYMTDYKFSYIDLKSISVTNISPEMFDEKLGWNVPRDFGISLKEHQKATVKS
jgi:DNA-binding Lrp family transcriptional regulator